MSKTYWEKLKDPRWQRKRLEAMQAAEFECQSCMDSESTLHVHHKQYFKGREPWEYDIGQLSVLCETFHAAEHEGEDALMIATSYLPLDGPFSRNCIASLVAGYANVPCPDQALDPICGLTGNIAYQLFSDCTIKEILAIYRFSRDDTTGLLTVILDHVQTKDEQAAA